MKYLLDTSVISLAMRGTPAVRARWDALAVDELLIPAIAVAEGLAGANKQVKPRWRDAWDAIIVGYAILPFDVPAAIAYGRLRAELEQRGAMIGVHDCEIAATALAWQTSHPDESLVLVTANEREFGRVPGLVVENWAR